MANKKSIYQQKFATVQIEKEVHVELKKKLHPKEKIGLYVSDVLRDHLKTKEVNNG